LALLSQEKMLKEAPAAATLPGAVGQEQNIISATTAITTANDKHADVSVHVEPDGGAGTIAGQANNAVEDAKKQRGAGGEKETRAKCCNCVARLKSCFYSFKLSKMGKVTFTLLAFLVPYDVVTDVIATWELYSSGHGWWGTIAVVILYMSLRFMFLFELMMQQTFLGLEKVCWFEVVGFQVPGRVSSVFWLYLPFSIFPLLLAKDGVTFSALDVGLGLLTEILLLFMVPFLSLPVLVYGVYRNIESVWGEDHQDWYLNPVGTQTSSFYAIVAMALEAVSEALPELLLQTRVFLASDPPLLSPFLYYQSMSLSLVSILKAAAVFWLSRDLVKFTIIRLGGNDQDKIEATLQKYVELLTTAEESTRDSKARKNICYRATEFNEKSHIPTLDGLNTLNLQGVPIGACQKLLHGLLDAIQVCCVAVHHSLCILKMATHMLPPLEHIFDAFRSQLPAR
jgi:hypothetical protein